MNMTTIECPKCGAHLELQVTLAGRRYDAEEMKSPADSEDQVQLATVSLFQLLEELGLSRRAHRAVLRHMDMKVIRQRGLIWYLWEILQGAEEVRTLGPTGREELRRALMAMSKVETPLSDGRRVGEVLLEIQATYEYARLFFALQDIKKAEEAGEALSTNATGA
ncbi:MAG: hypothetical protein JXM73_26320 [Anaerolineae bacterium]|nr:hypothetical protein [Anaerolineae bacterium]